MQIETFKCRASAAGQLMTNPKTKGEILSQTTKTYVETWLKEQIYGVKKTIDSKYLSKGIYFEDQAIDKAIEWLDLPFALKNTEKFSDDFFTGEPDLILPDCIVDIKNSWDCFTFPLFETDLPTDAYFYQVQVYMHLTGKKAAKIVYILLNTPETYNTPEIDYSNVSKEFRIKSFDIVYNPDIIEKLKQRVIDARNYIKNLKF